MESSGCKIPAVKENEVVSEFCWPGGFKNSSRAANCCYYNLN